MKTRLFLILLFILTLISIAFSQGSVRLKQIERADTTNQFAISNGKKNTLVWRDAQSFIIDSLGIGADSIYIENDSIKLIIGSGSIDLSTYLDNTDNQQLSLSNDTLFLEDGGYVVLTGLGGGSSIWSTNANGINYNSGNVGINKSNPAYNLDVDGDVKVNGRFYQNHGSNTTYGFLTGRHLSNNSSSQNTLIGYQTGINLGNTNSVYNNTLIGTYVGNNLTGSGNIGLGTYAGNNCTSCNDNMYIGYFTGANNPYGDRNVYIGTQAGRYSDGSNNIFIGYNSGKNITGNYKLSLDASDTSTPLIYGEFLNDLIRINGSLQITNRSGSAIMLAGFDANNKLVESPLVVDTDTQLSETEVDNYVANNGYLTSTNWTLNGSHIHNNNSGNVGINVPTPGYPLSVKGENDLIATLYGANSANNYLTITDPPSATGTIGLFGKNNTSTKYLEFWNGATLRHVLTHDKLGINQDNPIYELDVTGEARITGDGGTATTLTGRDASNVITDVAIGSGLSLSSGILSVSGTSGVTSIGITGTDFDITNSPITSSGNINLSITNNAVGSNELSSTGVTSGSYGSSSQIPLVTVDDDGRITNISTATIASDQDFGDFGSKLQSWGSNGTFGSGKDVGFGVDPTRDVDVNGDIRLRGEIYDVNNNTGSTGDVLTKTASGWEWDTPSIQSSYAQISFNGELYPNSTGTTTLLDFTGGLTTSVGDLSSSISTDRITASSQMDIELHFHATVGLDPGDSASSEGMDFRIYKNGSYVGGFLIQTTDFDTDEDKNMSASWILSLNANDYVQVYYNNDVPDLEVRRPTFLAKKL